MEKNEVLRQKKISSLINQVELIEIELLDKIYEICEMSNYKESSNFSYNIDKLKIFTKGLKDYYNNLNK